MRVLCATSAELPGLCPDDAPLLAAFERRGVEAVPAVWSDPTLDWASARITLIRSTWDYTRSLPAFLTWAATVDELGHLVNPLPLVRWSVHKRYLLALKQAGVPVVPTSLVTAGSAFDLAGHVDDRGWAEIVVKPAAGSGARGAERFPADEPEPAQAHLDRLLEEGDALIQPLLPSVLDDGEVSVVVIGDQVTHAVRKLPAEGDFRVQAAHGGRFERVEASPSLVKAAHAAVDAAPARPVYARVDLARGLDDKWDVMELELIEPELFFRLAPGAADALVDQLLLRSAD